MIDPERDPLDGFLDQARKALKRAEGTCDEAAQRRLLAGLEEVAPFALAPGAAEAAKRARDGFPGSGGHRGRRRRDGAPRSPPVEIASGNGPVQWKPGNRKSKMGGKLSSLQGLFHAG